MNIANRKSQINQCTGCGICSVACPQSCISVKRSEGGFFEAFVDESQCSNCGLCVKFCYKFFPFRVNTNKLPQPLSVHGVWSRDRDLINRCSSGGFATELARSLLKKDYKICGVVYDFKAELCRHTIAEKHSGIDEFIGSKYLQSYTADAFSQFKLNEKYLVFGTPCQMFALRKYIRFKKIEENFILVDFYCHGVPSYNLWKKYAELLKANGVPKIEKINFVSKRNGWHNRSILINEGSDAEYQNSYKSDMFGIFFGGMYCHNSPCFKCIFRMDLVCSDIRIADFWGSRFKSNQTGVSLLTINTDAGKRTFGVIREKLEIVDASVDDLRNSKPWRFYRRPIRYNKIMCDLQSDESLNMIYKRRVKPFLFLERNLHRLNRRMKRLLKF